MNSLLLCLIKAPLDVFQLRGEMMNRYLNIGVKYRFSTQLGEGMIGSGSIYFNAGTPFV